MNYQDVLGYDPLKRIDEKTGTWIRSKFSDKAKGELAQERLTDRLKKEWNIWKGKTGSSDNLSDVAVFLRQQGGFSPQHINDILDLSGYPTPEQNDSSADDEGKDSEGKVPTTRAERDAKRAEDRKERIKRMTQPKDLKPNNARFSVPTRPNPGKVKAKLELFDKRVQDFKDANGGKITQDQMKEIMMSLIGRKGLEDALAYAQRNESINEDEELSGKKEEDYRKALIDAVTKSMMEESVMITELSSGNDISSSELEKIFTKASQYAFKNGLIRGDRRDSEATGKDGKTTTSSTSNNDSGTSDDDIFSNVDRAKFLDIATRNGLNLNEIHDLIYSSAHIRNFGTIKDRSDINRLAIVGFAYLKSRKSQARKN